MTSAILDLKETRPQIRARLEARLAALRQQVQDASWERDTSRRQSNHARRIEALATGAAFTPEPEPDVAAMQREVADIEKALKLHDFADAVEGEPALQQAIDATAERILQPARLHLAALKRLAALAPELEDAIEDVRIQHVTRSIISDTAHAVGELHVSRVTFHGEAEALAGRLLGVCQHAAEAVKAATDAGLK